MNAPSPEISRKEKFKAVFDAAVEASKAGNYDEALAGFSKALVLSPRSLPAMRYLGDTLFKQERYDEALACFRRALDEKPDHVVSLLNLGLVLRKLWRFEEAAAALERAHALAPSDTRVLFHWALSLKDAGRLTEAEQRFRQTVELKPDHYDAEVARAMCLLLDGRYKEGWEAYEVRWKLKVTPEPRYQDRQWDGRPVKGPIFLSSEQGFGDTIMFCRFARFVRERCDRVILESQKQLKNLMTGVEGIDDIVVQKETVPPFARHAYLLSLPRLLNLTPQTIPAPVPYIRATPEREAWAANMMKVLGPLVRVGITWAGNPKYGRDRERSIEPHHILELLEARGIALLSLQKGAPVEQLGQLGCQSLISNLDRHINDFTDTAAIVAQLDIVVTCDSAVAHLAGAMGKPVWVAVPFAPDWRWFLGREDTPWYPTMRLFRQSHPGDWDGVFRRIGKELARFADELRARRAAG